MLVSYQHSVVVEFQSPSSHHLRTMSLSCTWPHTTSLTLAGFPLGERISGSHSYTGWLFSVTPFLHTLLSCFKPPFLTDVLHSPSSCESLGHCPSVSYLCHSSFFSMPPLFPSKSNSVFQASCPRSYLPEPTFQK